MIHKKIKNAILASNSIFELILKYIFPVSALIVSYVSLEISQSNNDFNTVVAKAQRYNVALEKFRDVTIKYGKYMEHVKDAIADTVERRKCYENIKPDYDKCSERFKINKQRFYDKNEAMLIELDISDIILLEIKIEMEELLLRIDDNYKKHQSKFVKSSKL